MAEETAVKKVAEKAEVKVDAELTIGQAPFISGNLGRQYHFEGAVYSNKDWKVKKAQDLTQAKAEAEAKGLKGKAVADAVQAVAETLAAAQVGYRFLINLGKPDYGNQIGNLADFGFDRLRSVKFAGLADAEQAEIETALTEFLAGGWVKTLAGEREKAAPAAKLTSIETSAIDAIARKVIRDGGGNPDTADKEAVKTARIAARAERTANSKLWQKAVAQFTKAAEL